MEQPIYPLVAGILCALALGTIHDEHPNSAKLPKILMICGIMVLAFGWLITSN